VVYWVTSIAKVCSKGFCRCLSLNGVCGEATNSDDVKNFNKFKSVQGGKRGGLNGKGVKPNVCLCASCQTGVVPKDIPYHARKFKCDLVAGSRCHYCILHFGPVKQSKILSEEKEDEKEDFVEQEIDLKKPLQLFRISELARQHKASIWGSGVNLTCFRKYMRSFLFEEFGPSFVYSNKGYYVTFRLGEKYMRHRRKYQNVINKFLIRHCRNRYKKVIVYRVKEDRHFLTWELGLVILYAISNIFAYVKYPPQKYVELKLYALYICSGWIVVILLYIVMKILRREAAATNVRIDHGSSVVADIGEYRDLESGSLLCLRHSDNIMHHYGYTSQVEISINSVFLAMLDMRYSSQVASTTMNATARDYLKNNHPTLRRWAESGDSYQSRLFLHYSRVVIEPTVEYFCFHKQCQTVFTSTNHSLVAQNTLRNVNFQTRVGAMGYISMAFATLGLPLPNQSSWARFVILGLIVPILSLGVMVLALMKLVFLLI